MVLCLEIPCEEELGNLIAMAVDADAAHSQKLRLHGAERVLYGGVDLGDLIAPENDLPECFPCKAGFEVHDQQRDFSFRQPYPGDARAPVENSAAIPSTAQNMLLNGFWFSQQCFTSVWQEA